MRTVRNVFVVGSCLVLLAACAGGGSFEPAPPDQETSPGEGGGGAGPGGHPGSSAAGAGGAEIVLSSSGSGGSGGFAACASTSIEATRVPLDMYVMIDRSGSMSLDGKWTAVTNAVENFATSASDSDQMAMGLQYFPLSVLPPCTTSSDCGGAACVWGFCSSPVESCAPLDYAKPAVAIGPLPATAQAITTSLQAHTPGGATPTAPALQGAVDHATSWRASHSDHTVVVVLATDGVPTECTPTLIGDIAVIAASGLAQGVPTFVIGVGIAQQQLDALAQYGGTGKALLVDIAGDPTAAFSAALDKVRHTAGGCNFQLPSGASADPTKVNVTLTPSVSGTPESLPKAADANACGSDLAWFYDNPANPAKIELCPAACDAFEASAGASVNILLGCTSIVK